jgi:phosphoserine phosphatase
MKYVLTVMAHPSQPLPGDIIDVMDTALADADLNLEGVSILSEGLAIDGFLEAEDAPDLASAFAGLPVDYALTAEDTRRKSLLIADMDSTIITSETLNDLAKLSGKGDAVAEITERAMRGELNFADSLLERVKMIGGTSAELINTIIDEVVLSEGAEALVATMRNHGARTILISGGFVFLTEVIQKRLGFDEHHANTLIIEDNVITGEVGMPIIDQDAKRDRLDLTVEAMGIGPEDVITVGDGANDRDMTVRAGIGVAYRGKDSLKAVADVKLDHADLRGLLWIQGYHDDDITTLAG